MKWLKKLIGKLTGKAQEKLAAVTETLTEQETDEKSTADKASSAKKKPAKEKPDASAQGTLDDEVFTDDTPTGQIITQPDADETPTSEIPAQSAPQPPVDDADVTAPRAVNEPYGPGSAKALGDGAAPSTDYTVKAKTASKLFHTKESANFSRLKADVWFKTVADAEKAGFTAWNKKTKAAPKKAAAPAENGAAAPAAEAAPAAAAAPAAEAAPAGDDAPHGAGSAKPNADGSAPSDEYTVKAKAASKLFHTKESANFSRLKADVWFRTVADAEKAGFTAWNAKTKAAKK